LKGGFKETKLPRKAGLVIVNPLIINPFINCMEALKWQKGRLKRKQQRRKKRRRENKHLMIVNYHEAITA
jgi:hypothetical protein